MNRLLHGRFTNPANQRFAKHLRRYRDNLFVFLDRADVEATNYPAEQDLLVPGEILGPFKFYGTRPDDGNDIFPHEHRRELRGYRVFCAWLNHDDSRSINTLDTYVDGHVKHYLIDFGSTLGSGSDVLRNIAPQNPRAGNEYLIDLGHAWKRAYTFGVWDQPWRKVKFLYPKYAEIGRFEGEFFEPEKWVPEYPNPAFDRMLADDAFWAAKIIARFSDDAIRAIVKTGDYLSPSAERYLADTLIKRRDKVVAYFFRQLNPLDGFAIDGTRLRFQNLGSDAEETYRHQWFVFDNDTATTKPIADAEEGDTPSIAIPVSDAKYLMVRVRTVHDKEIDWRKAVDVFLRRTDSGFEVVGIDREL